MTQGSLCVLLVALALAQGRLDGLSGKIFHIESLLRSNQVFLGVPSDVFSDLDEYFRNSLWPLQNEDLLFPSLSEAQQKFAVNPSYPQYSATVFGDPSAAQSRFWRLN